MHHLFHCVKLREITAKRGSGLAALEQCSNIFSQRDVLVFLERLSSNEANASLNDFCDVALADHSPVTSNCF
jgi:hypothetical protein